MFLCSAVHEGTLWGLYCCSRRLLWSFCLMCRSEGLQLRGEAFLGPCPHDLFSALFSRTHSKSLARHFKNTLYLFCTTHFGFRNCNKKHLCLLSLMLPITIYWKHNVVYYVNPSINVSSYVQVYHHYIEIKSLLHCGCWQYKKNAVKCYFISYDARS
jgi:hypothetical protein